MRKKQIVRLGRSAFTLLEVILALAILAGAVAVLGEIMAIAGRHGREAQAGVRAQLLASSVMDEILAGTVELNPISKQPLETTDTVPWAYSVTVENTTITGLSAIEVIVEQDLEPQFSPVKFTLKRWYAVPTTTSTPTDATGAEARVVNQVSRDTERQRSGAGFTLLEVVLAIGLCGAVMALLATAIDMYLVRVDTSRTQVETAELARALLTKIADDLRAVRYSSAPTSVPTGGGGDTGGDGFSGGGSSGSGFGSTASNDLGIYGTLLEIRIDRAAERSYQQVTVPSTELTETADPNDMPQTVEYYFEEGRTMKAGDLAAGGVADTTSLAGYTGLYRRQTPTAALAAASSLTGGSSASESAEPAELLAPEVVQLSFMYSDGTTWFEEWDSATQQALPAAVEIKVSLFSDVLGSEPAARQADEEARRRDPTRWVEYRLLVRIPQLDEPQELTGPAAPSAQQQPPGQEGENGT